MTIKRGRCTAKTREKILKDLKGWAIDPKGAKVYWMNGMAGTRKTTIIYSLCKWLEENGQLGGNFFCSRISSSCRDMNNIIPTLAYQLAQNSPAFPSILCKVLKAKPQFSKLDVRWQSEKLLQEPMQVMKAALPEDVAIVIDTLDECDDGDTFRLFLETLLKLAANLPIKFFLTSRPEPAIHERMLASLYSCSVVHLHNIKESIVDADIKKYLTEALRSMSPPPSANDMERLTKRVGKFFIYAVTSVQYILPCRAGMDSSDRLQTLLGMDSWSTEEYDGLDQLYSSILYAAVRGLTKAEVHKIQLTLRTVVCAKEPMTAQTLASHLSLSEAQVRVSLEPLRSVLHVQDEHVPDNIYGLVAPFHASFPDYLFHKLRSGDFHCEMAGHSEVLANGCFDLMRTQLKFNICELESSFVFDKDVLDLQDRIKKFISPALSYACRYWGEHLRQGNFTDKAHEMLVDFLTHRLLFWIEVLNLEQHLMIGPELLHYVQAWLKVREYANDSDYQTEIKYKDSHNDTLQKVADAEAFIARFAAGVCACSTGPHIYISGLPFCPKSNWVYENYWPRRQGLIDVRGSTMEQWPSAAIGIWETDSKVNSVAFSPDGMHIVSGSSYQTIQVWDACTGDTVAGPFKGHTQI